MPFLVIQDQAHFSILEDNQNNTFHFVISSDDENGVAMIYSDLEKLSQDLNRLQIGIANIQKEGIEHVN